MATGRNRFLAPWIALATLATTGCAQSGPFASRQTTVGSLKASVSQLEFENQKLRNDVGELKAENSRLDNELVQEQQANGVVTARLDDAKNLLRRQGGDMQALGIPSKNFEDNDIPAPVPSPNPQVRRSKNGRKPPRVELPRIEADVPFGSSANPDDVSYEPLPTRRPRDLGPSDVPDEDRWLPVARGLGSAVRQ